MYCIQHQAAVSDSRIRSRRRKCVTLTDGGSTTCSYCRERGFTCHRDGASIKALQRNVKAFLIQTPALVSAESHGLPLPPPELCMELVELYFDLIHDQFHSLFHRPSFIEDVRRGEAPRLILFAMMALAAR